MSCATLSCGDADTFVLHAGLQAVVWSTVLLLSQVSKQISTLCRWARTRPELWVGCALCIHWRYEPFGEALAWLLPPASLPH